MSNFNDLYDHVAADRSRAMQLLGIQDIRRKAVSELLAAGAYTEPDNIDDMTDAEREQHKAEAAYALGGGGYAAPAQTVGDFLAHRPSIGPGSVTPTYRPAVRWCDLHDCLPPFVCAALEEALLLLEKKLHGFAAPDAVLTAVETRSSSPVRIVRDNTYQTALRGLYPCGEGAGYAGGILSAAADGMRCAEQIIKEITQHG